eukprot:5875898-Karenia_brevis.AAC.1
MHGQLVRNAHEALLGFWDLSSPLTHLQYLYPPSALGPKSSCVASPCHHEVMHVLDYQHHHIGMMDCKQQCEKDHHEGHDPHVKDHRLQLPPHGKTDAHEVQIGFGT